MTISKRILAAVRPALAGFFADSSSAYLTAACMAVETHHAAVIHAASPVAETLYCPLLTAAVAAASAFSVVPTVAVSDVWQCHAVAALVESKSAAVSMNLAQQIDAVTGVFSPLCVECVSHCGLMLLK